jgi:transcriptional regulator with XRE-family HTH domain
LEGQELAERHIDLRERAGLTQEQEAKRAGVSPTTISGIESGKIARPHLRTLLKIARALGADVGELREPGKAGAPSSPDQPSFNGLLEEERREPKPPEPPEAEQIDDLRTWTVFFPGREEGPDLKAAFWIECLNTQADLCERIIACGGYDLETMWDLEGATIELWGAYSKTLRELVHQWCTPGQADALQRAEDRMKAARTAARRAYQERRDAEEDRQKVVDLDARRRLREARYTDQGYANAGT